MMSGYSQTVSTILVTCLDLNIAYLEDSHDFYWKMWAKKTFFRKIGQNVQDHDEYEFGLFSDQYIPNGLLTRPINHVSRRKWITSNQWITFGWVFWWNCFHDNVWKLSIRSVQNLIFLAKTKRCMVSTFHTERRYNHPKCLYRTDFWINPVLIF